MVKQPFFYEYHTPSRGPRQMAHYHPVAGKAIALTRIQKNFGNDIRVEPYYLSGEKSQRGEINQRRVQPYE